MTLLELLARMTSGTGSLIALLEHIERSTPDLAPEARNWINKLNETLTSDSLVALAGQFPREIANILQGKIHSHHHPSDAA